MAGDSVQFGRIPTERLAAGLLHGASASDMAVFYALCGRVNANWCCWPSVLTIAKACGFTPRTVNRAIVRLQARGAIEINRRGGRGRSNIYIVRSKNPDAPVRVSPPETLTPQVRDSPPETLTTQTPNPDESGPETLTPHVALTDHEQKKRTECAAVAAAAEEQRRRAAEANARRERDAELIRRESPALTTAMTERQRLAVVATSIPDAELDAVLAQALAEATPAERSSWDAMLRAGRKPLTIPGLGSRIGKTWEAARPVAVA